MTKASDADHGLPPDVAATLRAAVDSGEFGSMADAISAALTEWHDSRTDNLSDLLREGIESGPGIDADAAFAAIRARITDVANA